jgi:hypothetical protein
MGSLAARRRDLDCGAAVAELRADLGALLARVAVLEAAASRRGPRDDDDRAVVVALAAAIDRTAHAVEASARLSAVRFAARDVRRLARQDVDLRAALVRADAVSAKSIGRLLARVEGHPIDGITVERAGASGGTVVWRLVSSVSRG